MKPPCVTDFSNVSNAVVEKIAFGLRFGVGLRFFTVWIGKSST